jgi:amino acid adenylation domain-containing protein/non-ribosomal peptide synthase protein (TIGR01720 family)
MTSSEFLSYLRSLDFKLWLEGDNLRYSAPTGVLTPNLREQLAENKNEIVIFLRKAMAAVDSTSPPLLPGPRDAELPLSFAQQRLWFVDQLSPDSSAYNMCIAVRFIGPLNIAALTQTLEEITRRHEILRTTFPIVDEGPYQLIADASALELRVVDLGSLPKGQQELLVDGNTSQEAQRPFNLARGPLLRATLLRNGEQDHMILLTMHHIVSDAWSLAVLIHEVAALYEAFSLGAPSPLNELSIQYADFARWQREWLQGDVLEKQLSYWKRQLDGSLPVLNLPTDKQRPAVQSLRGDSKYLVLSESLSKSIKDLCRREGATLFMTLLAAFKILLHRYTGQSEIVVGSSIANRNRLETKELIGLFVNTLVMRIDLSGDPSFKELLEQVRKVTLEAYANQDLPFEMLVEELQPERDLSRNPLFQVMFAFQNTPLTTALELPGLTISIPELERKTALFDLGMMMGERDQRIWCALEYSTDLFEAPTIVRMLDHLQTLLQSIVDASESSISSLNLLSEVEREELVEQWSGKSGGWEVRERVDELIAAQARQRPEAIAVVSDEEHVSYGALNRRANQLAHYLQRRGIGAESVVGVAVERSAEMVVALLGILKAGGAYLPLDVEQPASRLQAVWRDSGAQLLLSGPRDKEELREKLGEEVVTVLCVADEWEVVQRESAAEPESGAGGENLSYVIYTSGSTGQAKGVGLTHRGLSNLAVAQGRKFGLGPESRVLQFAVLSFDASVSEIFTTLSSGGVLHLGGREAEHRRGQLMQVLREEQITVVTLPPALLAVTRAEELPALATLVVAGEACPWEVAERWSSGRRLLNAYGPTETTVCATMHEWAGESVAAPRRGTVSIGLPMENMEVYVLDEGQQLVGVGVSGELCIGGLGVGRGYLGQAALTAEKFIPHPFSGVAGARLYRSGDVVRYRGAGELEFMGRVDDQVKVRGHRVELGEVEAALRQERGVKEAAVVVRGEQAGEKQLVGYVVSDEEWLGEVELKARLRARLPEYMVPSVVVKLAEMPVNRRGKLDRQALPAPDGARPQLQREFIAPRTPAEQILAEIVQQILRVERVGLLDNFFELGGDSILATQVVTRANQAGLRLTPKQIFQYQTIEELAAIAGTSPEVYTEQGLVTGPVPLTPIQHHFFKLNIDNPHQYNQAVLLKTQPGLDIGVLESAVQHLVLHHDTLRLRFVPDDSGWQAFNAGFEEELSITRVDLASLPAAEQTQAIQTTATRLQASLNISDGPLLRIAFFDLGAHEPGRLLIIIHHLAIDVISWRIFLEDLQTVYEQISQGEAIYLPPKTTSFKEWAERLVAYSHSETLHQELSYWLTQPWAEVSSLPVDYSLAANIVNSARAVRESLSVEETRALLHDVPKIYRTEINDVLLTALVQACASWTGERSLLLELEGHGREEIAEGTDLSRTVGWFTSVFPVLLRLGQAHDLPAALKTVKEQLRKIPSRGLGYGVLKYLSMNGDLANQLRTLPQAGVMFNYMGRVDLILPEASLFEPADESSGPTHILSGKRPHLIEVYGSVLEEQLQMVWVYSENVHKRATIEAVAREFMDVLRRLINYSTGASWSSTPQDTDRDGVEDFYPLSPAQQGILFHTLYSPRTRVYFQQITTNLYGEIHVSHFARAWQQVVDRHPILRTSFAWEDLSEPLQLVHQQVQLPLEQQDWRGLTAIEQEQQLKIYLRDDLERGFDLSNPPLIRLALIRIAEQAYTFIWSSHHMLLDGWSGALVYKEALAFYQAFNRGESLNIERPRLYKDYIEWIGKQDRSEAEAFWRLKLKGFSAATPLIAKLESMSLPDEEEGFGSKQVRLSAAATAALQSLGRQHRLTMNTLVQGGWALLLSRYSGQKDIVFGTVVSGRPHDLDGVESMVGLFINTLPMRFRISPEASLLSWLQEAQEQQVETRRFEHSALVDIQGWSEVPRGQPLFESIYAFENYPVIASSDEVNLRLKTEVLSAFERTSYSLTVMASVDTQLTLRILYDRRWINDAVIIRMLSHFQNLLEDFAANSDKKLSALSIMNEEESNQLLGEFNANLEVY